MEQNPRGPLFEIFLEQLPEGVILCDEAWNIVYVNPSAEAIRNIREEEKLGSNILDCHKEESREKVARALDHIKVKKGANFHRTVFDQNNQKIYRNTYAPLCDRNDGLKGLAIVSRDITKERDLEGKRVQEARKQEIAIANLQSQYQGILMAAMEMLSNVMEAKDVHTDGHSKRVTKYATDFYEHVFGLDNTYYDIEFAAKLHDIGKICIPDHIIQKPGKLTDEELKVVRKHPSIAANLVAKIDPGSRITPYIRYHHERYDGAGYPEGLAGEKIPLGARIISLADSFDAMRTDRPYRKGLSAAECVREITDHAGTQFDPALAKEFCELIRTGSID
mgnify:CR=1 FL=1